MNIFDSNLSIVRNIGAGFVLIGSLVALTGIIWLIRTGIFVIQAAKAPGTVIEMECSTDSEGNSAYYPIFTFADASGVVHTHRTSYGSSWYTFEPGQKVTVLYNPATPKHSKIDSFVSVWLGPLAILGLGLLFEGIACLWFPIATRATRYKG